MIYGQENHDKFVSRNPHAHRKFSSVGAFSRRQFFEIAGAGVTASCLAANAFAEDSRPAAATQNKAKNVIFILMTGAPSHTDTFDFKMVNGVTPSNFAPAKINGVDWPTGLLPKTGQQLGNICIVRSMHAWALVHSLSQTWTQIGRNPAAALGDVAPSIGTIVSLELEKQRLPSQVFPAFIALNAVGASGSGYLSSGYGPFKVSPQTAGLSNTTNADGVARTDSRLRFLHTIDDPLRVNSPVSKNFQDYDAFYGNARNLMYNPAVNTAFSFTATDSERYGKTSFGNACLVAKQILQANQGTRYIHINVGNWDMHNDIYGAQTPNGTNLYTVGRDMFDTGYATLLADLNSSGLLKDTLVVVAGEFGRTVGALSGAGGRDHYVQQFAAFAGAGVKGGRTIGSTNAAGSDVVDFGWQYQRYVRPEDVEATIYSALGIDWTKQIDTPFGRTFEYVPFAGAGTYAPIDELWG